MKPRSDGKDRGHGKSSEKSQPQNISVRICVRQLMKIWELGRDVGVDSNLYKGGRSTTKFYKFKIRKFEDLNHLLQLRTFRKCGGFAVPVFFCDLRFCISWIWDLQAQFFFADLKLPQVR